MERSLRGGPRSRRPVADSGIPAGAGDARIQPGRNDRLRAVHLCVDGPPGRYRRPGGGFGGDACDCDMANRERRSRDRPRGVASVRVLMIGPYPRAADKIDGGVAAATTYLSQALARRTDVELIGVRVARDGRDQPEDRTFGWPIADLPLGRLSLSTNFFPQRRRLRELLARYEPQVVHAQGADLAGLLAVT